MNPPILSQDEVDALLQGITGESQKLDAAPADDDEPKPKKKKKKAPVEPNPIKHVHFSNFIVQ